MPSASDQGPVRTCIGCRRRDAQSALLRLAAAGGEVTPDPRRRLPGRGAYVHRRGECLRRALRRKGWQRVLGAPAPPATRMLEELCCGEEAVTTVAGPR